MTWHRCIILLFVFNQQAAKSKSWSVPTILALLSGGANISAKDASGDTVLNYMLRWAVVMQRCYYLYAYLCYSYSIWEKFIVDQQILEYFSNSWTYNENLFIYYNFLLIKSPLLSARVNMVSMTNNGSFHMISRKPLAESGKIPCVIFSYTLAREAARIK